MSPRQFAGIKLAYALELVQSMRSIPGPQPSHQLEIQMPQYAKLSDAECSAIHIARAYAPSDARKTMKREVFSRAKVAFGIPANHKMLCDVDINEPNHGVLKNKATREPYELDANGKWVGAANGAMVAPKRWFQLPVDELQEAITEALDALDHGGNIMSQVQQPNGRVAHPHYEHIVFGEDGSLWVQLDADAYHEPETEEEDDHPY